MHRFLLAGILSISAFSQGFGQFSLISTNPAANSMGVAVDQSIVLQFNSNVHPNTSSSDFSVISDLRGSLTSTFNVSTNTVTIVPSSPFLVGEKITVNVFTTLKSSAGVSLSQPRLLQFYVEPKPGPHAPPTFLDSDVSNLNGNGRFEIISPADMDRDGDLDLVAGIGQKIVWLENDGTENFPNHAVTTFPYTSANLIRPFDIDRDGDLDLIVAAQSLGLMIFKNDGGGNFQLSSTTTGSGISGLDVADFDSNGSFDILYSAVELIGNVYVPGTFILYNQGSEVFNKVKIKNTTNYNSFCVDLDHDGDWDIVYHDDVSVGYSLNTGGTFSTDTVFNAPYTTIEKLVVGDVNNDGNIDVAFMTYNNFKFSLVILSNDGAAHFTPTTIEATYGDQLTSLADYDGDGDQDFFILDGNYTYTMLENNGSLSFTRKEVAHRLPSIFYPVGPANGDFDNDGDLDFFAAPAGSILKLYKNTLYPFELATPSGLPSLSMSDADWGDYDNDGDLDLLTMGFTTTGSGKSLVYENQGGNLIEKSTSLTGLWLGSCDWGDYDNDGDLDILLAGASDSNYDDRKAKSLIYRNDNGVFTLLPSATQLPGVWYGEARWADFNNDGWLDIVFNASGYSGIYQGDGFGNFVKRYDLPFVFTHGNVGVGDYDRDGDLDVAVSGWGGNDDNGTLLKVFRNEGNWNFSEASGNFVGRIGGNIDWADMDNDGDLDLVVSGNIRYEDGWSNPSITVYRNQDGAFTLIENTEFISRADDDGTTSTGDFDNDGITDVIASTQGGSSFSPDLTLLKNTGQGDLKATSVELPNIVTRVANWVDYDRDHDLDLFVQTELLQNNSEVKNTAPSAPATIQVDSVYNNSIYLRWGAGSDLETGSAGLSYQIYAGTGSHAQNVVNANSILANGIRKVSELGNTKGNFTRIEYLRGGTYFYGVQSVDAAFEGSPFTNEQQVFVIGIHGKSGVCRGMDYSYVTYPSGVYTWEVNGGTIVSGQGTDSLIVHWDSPKEKGLVKVSDGQGHRNTLPINIDEIPNPAIAGKLTVCTGLETYTNLDNLSHHATWMVSGTNSVATESAHQGIIDWQSSGEYTLVVKAYPEHDGCFAFDTLQIRVDQRPDPQIQGPAFTCIDAVDKYSTESSHAQWAVTNGSIVVDSTRYARIQWPSTGTGYVRLSETSARAYCTSIDTVVVKINPRPPKPYLTLYQDTIIVSSPSPTEIYTWYYNDQPIFTGSYSGVIPYVSGVFMVEVFNYEGCGSKSDPFHFSVTALEEPGTSETNFLSYPNPTHGEMVIELDNDYRGKMDLMIYSTSGGLSKELMLQKTDQVFRQEINVTDLDAGYFVLIINAGGRVYSTKFIKY